VSQRDSGLSPETEEVLRRAGAGEPMPMLHKRRLKGTVLARVAVASTATLAAGHAAGQATIATTTTTAMGVGMGLTAKVAVGLAIVGSLGAGVTLAVRPRHHVERSANGVVAVVAPVVVPMPAPAEAPPVEAPPAEEPVALEPRRHAHRVVHYAHHAAAVPASTLAAETSLLRDADKALRAGDTTTALLKLDEDAARFPNGALAPERAAERLLVQCQAGAADPKAVSQFLASHSGSPLAARVRRDCAPTP
jgi:hypothetical protein